MNSSLHSKNEPRDTMKNSGIILILLVMVLSSSAYATLADCPACVGKAPDWTASATDFLEGKPTNDIPSGLNGPQQARLIDAQIDPKKSLGQASNAVSNSMVTPPRNSIPTLNIVLNDISAVPNPANFSDPIKITVVIGNNSSNTQADVTPNNLSTSRDLSNVAVYASIKNLAGTDIGRVNLHRTSGNEYTGIWNANIVPGTYKATIDASGSGGSKTFDDALQIVVNNVKNITRIIHAIRKLG